jgi:hypothetical protein
VEHEITEIMGRISLLGDTTPDYSVIDLFRYLSSGVRDLRADKAWAHNGHPNRPRRKR